MTDVPPSPPIDPDPGISDAQRDAIEAVLGPLPGPLLLAVRDARGAQFQRLEFLGDAVLELVVRFHALVADGSCDCGGDADDLTTDHALGRAARRAGVGRWLEWEASAERLADLVEACAAAVWLANGWPALANYVGRVIHPLTPLGPGDVEHGWHRAVQPAARRAREVLGASVLEVAAAHAAFTSTDEGPGALTDERNRLYTARRVVEHARAKGWPEGVTTGTRREAFAHARDAIERRLADTALARGLPAAVAEAADLLADPQPAPSE